MKVIKVKSLPQFLETAIKIDSEAKCAWFRGLPSRTFELIPGIYRSKMVRSNETNLIDQFYIHAPSLLRREFQNGWEWLAFMQHYGLPTRLLDWSESCLTALFFAIDGICNSSRSPCVWVVDAHELNRPFGKECGTFIADNPRLYPWIPTTLHFPENIEASLSIWQKEDIADRNVIGRVPVAVYCQAIDPRLVVQKGVFTLHGKYESCLSQYARQNQSNIWRIDIEGKFPKAKLEFLKCLDLAGVNRSTLFPDAENLSAYLKWHFANHQ